VDQEAVVEYIKTAFADIEVLEADGNFFFYYSPEHVVPEKTFPFTTLVANDLYDQVSDLDRAGVYRLNVGVSKDTYLGLFGVQPEAPGEAGVVQTGDDFKALDQVMPHPIYGHLFWLCVLRPGQQTFETIKPLLAEAYQRAVSQYERKAARGAG